MIEKAKITKIGIVKDGTAIGWGFDAEGKNIPGVAFRDGKPALICGYTLEELTDIANTEVTDLAEKLLTKVNKTQSCWVWVGAKSGSGYGRIRVGDKLHQAHRISYELFRESIPAGMNLDHLCLNKLCVNPEHLEVVTSQTNTLRFTRARAKCRNGHRYTNENTWWRKNSSNVSEVNSEGLTRTCRTCYRDGWQRQNIKRRLTERSDRKLANKNIERKQ